MAGEDSTIDLKPLASIIVFISSFQLVVYNILPSILRVSLFAISLSRNKYHINDQMENIVR